jgi:hypothetical protein
LNTSGVGATATIRVKYGGTTIHTFTTISLVSSSFRYADISQVFLGAENATNAQRSMMDHKQGGGSSSPGSGTGGWAPGNDHNSSVNRGIAVDSTADQTLAVTVQLSAAHADLRFRRRGVWVEHISSALPSAPGDGSKLIAVYAPNWQTAEGVVRNTTTETAVYTFTIPGGTLGANDLLIFQGLADIRQFSGSNAQWVHEVELGGTNLFTTGTGIAITSDPLRYAGPMEVWIGGAGVTNAQRCAMSGLNVATVSGSGEAGDAGNAGWQIPNSTNAASLDMTTDQTLVVKTTLNTANPDFDYRMIAAVLLLVKA